MNGWLTVGLLVVSNIFMTLAWYGQLKLSEMKVITPNTPIIWIILASWGVALLEYWFMVPANIYGFTKKGGQISLNQLKVMQEVISLLVFSVFAIVLFKGESLHWNHLLAFGLLVAAVYLVFME